MANYVVDQFSTGVALTWATDEPVASHVEYGTPAELVVTRSGDVLHIRAPMPVRVAVSPTARDWADGFGQPVVEARTYATDHALALPEAALAQLHTLAVSCHDAAGNTTVIPLASLAAVRCPHCDKQLARNLRGTLAVRCPRCKADLLLTR